MEYVSVSKKPLVVPISTAEGIKEFLFRAVPFAVNEMYDTFVKKTNIASKLVKKSDLSKEEVETLEEFNTHDRLLPFRMIEILCVANNYTYEYEFWKNHVDYADIAGIPGAAIMKDLKKKQVRSKK